MTTTRTHLHNLQKIITYSALLTINVNFPLFSGRSIDRQTEFSANVLFNIIRTKKPVVLVTTKNDEACEAYVKEAEKLVQRKEFRQQSVPVVVTYIKTFTIF